MLRTRPIPRHDVESQFENFGTDRLLNGGETPWVPATIENPSDCLQVLVAAFAWASCRYQVTAGNRFEVRIETQVVGGDDPVSSLFVAGRGAPGSGDEGPNRARAITSGNSPGDGSVGRDQVIASTGAVRRVNEGGTNNLVQSDSAVSIREGTVYSNAAVDTAMVAIDNGTRELGGANGMARPRRFVLQPGDSMTFRTRIKGNAGSSGDTFSDVNIGTFLMMTSQPQVP